ncbi:MAG: hypothetical protein R3F34_05740 [Planctomycetota bacterium]
MAGCITLVVLLVLWSGFSIARVLFGFAPWGPKVGGTLPNGIEVHFRARPGGFETDDRLTVIAPGTAPRHHWVDRVHGGFEHVVLKYVESGNKLWVESDGKVGASIDLTTNDFRAELDTQHGWAAYGTGTTLDSGDTSSILSLLMPW